MQENVMFRNAAIFRILIQQASVQQLILTCIIKLFSLLANVTRKIAVLLFDLNIGSHSA